MLSVASLSNVRTGPHKMKVAAKLESGAGHCLPRRLTRISASLASKSSREALPSCRHQGTAVVWPLQGRLEAARDGRPFW